MDNQKRQSVKIKKGIEKYKLENKRWGRKNKQIDKKHFDKYVHNNLLIISKSAVAKIFGVSRTTLIKWMKKNDYTHLINKQPEHLRD